MFVSLLKKLSNSIISQPMVQMSQRGTWPHCVGMTGEDCVAYIESTTDDLQGKVVLVSLEEMPCLESSLFQWKLVQRILLHLIPTALCLFGEEMVKEDCVWEVLVIN